MNKKQNRFSQKCFELFSFGYYLLRVLCG